MYMKRYYAKLFEAGIGLLLTMCLEFCSGHSWYLCLYWKKVSGQKPEFVLSGISVSITWENLPNHF